MRRSRARPRRPTLEDACKKRTIGTEGRAQLPTLSSHGSGRSHRIAVNGNWVETTQNKTESTGTHVMNSTTTALDGSSSVTVTGGRIDLN